MVVKSVDITRDKKDNEKRKQCEEQHVLIPLPYHTPAVLYPVNSFYWWDMYLDNLQFTSNICHLTAGDITCKGQIFCTFSAHHGLKTDSVLWYFLPQSCSLLNMICWECEYVSVISVLSPHLAILLTWGLVTLVASSVMSSSFMSLSH